jgi:hypothetical protein
MTSIQRIVVNIRLMNGAAYGEGGVVLLLCLLIECPTAWLEPTFWVI